MLDEHAEAVPLQYVIPSHVYCCITREGVVFLDLKRDKYLGIGVTASRALRELVRGWPTSVDRTSDVGASLDEETLNVTEVLLKNGLLTKDQSLGNSSPPIVLPRPQAAFAETNPGDWPYTHFIHAVRFLKACAGARLMLRMRTLEQVVRGAEARKQRCARRAGTLDVESARRLVKVFFRLRPFVFTGRDACLYESLALVDFLASFNFFPTWVFGVKTGPFEAHSWVQHDDTVLNDSPEHARAFTPIMAI